MPIPMGTQWPMNSFWHCLHQLLHHPLFMQNSWWHWICFQLPIYEGSKHVCIKKGLPIPPNFHGSSMISQVQRHSCRNGPYRPWRKVVGCKQQRPWAGWGKALPQAEAIYIRNWEALYSPCTNNHADHQFGLAPLHKCPHSWPEHGDSLT